ncbi:hypothetical protein HJC23_000493 [Cyclotella cryptica]|uniref:Peroxisomal membrane protein PEX16 n=1 Tax=Cyclotella cryptica TaxID=29204 RepID=A0ABD3QAK9_9STRA|eukprot:CCRYP_007260-RA/>CCRYP_007260-RA protein AED:0.21 eAED:0.22 QI:0/-1/0/1/-1/1/1/0/553
MSSQRGVVAPLKFSAGGSKHSTQKSSAVTITTPPPPPPPTIKSNALTVLSTGLTLKRSPLHLENWIACLLTLDGRDKFTKVLQYSCRLLSWYFGGLASSLPSSPAAAAAATGGGLTHLFQDTHHRSILYQLLSHRFHLLYQSLVESRKAFRLGRSFIEYDKLRSMGWGEYLMGVVRRSPLLSEGMGGRRYGRELELKRRRRQFHAQSIPEHHDEDASSSSSDHVDGGEDHGQESWNEDDEDSDEEEKKAESASEAQPVKVIARPGRPHLPSRVSSNIGWGPSTASVKYKDDSSQATPQRTTTTAATCTSPPKRTLSELGNMYQSTRSSSMGWIQSTKTNNASKAPDVVPPPWKLIGTTFKLIGLMGFWTFDNLAFLTGSGFLDPLGGNGAGSTTTTTTTTSGSVDAKSLRIQRKKRASEWGARFYFMGALAGLYVNVRGIVELWNGALRKARGEVARAVVSSTTNTTTAKEATASSSEDAILQAKQQLKAAETKLFELYLALLKSICDCIVFSNNPGVDLHLKLRGRKNHEGLHCCCGLISAGTVLFGNFPNA